MMYDAPRPESGSNIFTSGTQSFFLERLRCMYFFDDFAEDTASVVVEETPVERIEPLLSLRVGDGGKCSDNRIHPATCAEHSKYRLIAVEQQVREKDRGQPENETQACER